MSEHILCFQKDTLHFTSSNAPYASFHVRIGEEAFPAPVWNDFVIVLTWWHAALRVLTADKHDKAELRFMEGSHFISATSSGDGYFHLTAVTDRGRGQIKGPPTTVSAPQLLNEICEACKATVSACDKARVTSRDVDELRRISDSAA